MITNDYYKSIVNSYNKNLSKMADIRMEKEQKLIESKVNQDLFTFARECDMTVYEYVKENIKAAETFFFHEFANDPSKMHLLNKKLLEHIKDVYGKDYK